MRHPCSRPTFFSNNFFLWNVFSFNEQSFKGNHNEEVKFVFIDVSSCFFWALRIINLFDVYLIFTIFWIFLAAEPLNPLGTNASKWLNTLKQLVSKSRRNNLTIFDHKFDHFGGLALKRLIVHWHIIWIFRSPRDIARELKRMTR